MRILIVTPAPSGSLKGNRITALRWARLLRELGHQVTIDQQFHGQKCDVLIALHARRSARSVSRFHGERPGNPLILALTGTDLYRDIRLSKSAQKSLELADRLVLLQPDGITWLPKRIQAKVSVIYQSVPTPTKLPPKLKNAFEVCVIGHLRLVKDPFRAAMAARRLPSSSRVRVVHIGSALSEAMQRRAEAEMEVNPRYTWLGELSHAKSIHRLARSRLMVLSSKMEGGANVISEAVAVSVPVISSHISGSVGLLGSDYPGYFPVGDTHALAELIHRCEVDQKYYDELSRQCERIKPLIEPENERQRWQQLLNELVDA